MCTKIRFKTKRCENAANLFIHCISSTIYGNKKKTVSLINRNSKFESLSILRKWQKKRGFPTALIHITWIVDIKSSSSICDGIDFKEHWIYKYYDSIRSCSKLNRKWFWCFNFWKGFPIRTTSFTCNILCLALSMSWNHQRIYFLQFNLLFYEIMTGSKSVLYGFCWTNWYWNCPCSLRAT